MAPTPAEIVLGRLAEGTASAAELERALDQSQSSVSRLLRDLMGRGLIIRLGTTRGSRYGLLRAIEGIGSSWPLRRIDEQGTPQELGTLHALAGTEYFFQPADRRFHWAGLSDGLPYFLQDQRPAGFLGRAVPRRYPQLALPQRVVDWTDDHYLRYLTQHGSDPVSDLLLGDRALDEYLASLTRTALPAAQRVAEYPRLADDVMEGGLPGSSAHGEHPKFALLVEEQGEPRHLLVKFSPPVSSNVGQRWSDLLIAEHLAHQTLRVAGLVAVESRIEQLSGRTFLETTRFDRTGREGRIGVTSLYAIDSVLYGKLDNWIAAATRLARDRRIDDATVEQVRLLFTFGALIGNTDRHFGNLAFFDRYDGKFRLAPVYDMLPMLYAPEHVELIDREFQPAGPTAETLHAFGRARSLAEQYWQACAGDERISSGFRRIAAANLATLQALPRTGAYASAEERTRAVN
jgi:DNA-binding transcriptional ArsR family regulator